MTQVNIVACVALYRSPMLATETSPIASGSTGLRAAAEAAPMAQRQSAPVATNLCTLDVYDMDCAACAILIESELRKCAGVSSVSVHYATQRARIAYDAEQTNELALAEFITSLGHAVRSDSALLDRAAIVRKIRRRYQWQTGLAAFCAMQIMMFSLPRFLGGDEIELPLARLMDGAALLLTLPVLFFCACSFFRGATREWRIRRVGMDSAVAVSLASAFAGSVWHVWSGSGQLYFDSIAMFVALLLGVRWFEWERREANRTSLESLAINSATASYALLNQGDQQVRLFIDIAQIAVDSRLLIGHLQSVPVDGYLESDAATLDESVLTGESTPAMKCRNAKLSAGTINLGEPFVLRAQSTAEKSTTQRLLDLADQSERPEYRARFASVSRIFVPALFVVAMLTFIAFFHLGIDVALERAIAVLIVSCPCALALAAPAAYARAFTQLASLGMIVRRGDSLDRLTSVDTFVFDKTGTLTDPHEFKLNYVRAQLDFDQVRAIIASLEAYANHPLAKSLRAAFAHRSLLSVDAAAWKPGYGVNGAIEGVEYRLGRKSYVVELFSGPDASPDSEATPTLYLADSDGIVCTIEFLEALRPGAHTLTKSLSGSHNIEIMSGDRQDRVDSVATLLGIARAQGDTSAAKKQQRVETLQRAGRVVAMVGDGWNDSVAFAKADVSIAAAGATDAALRSADLISASASLEVLKTTLDYAKRLRQIILQNYAWAIAYNLVAIPFAALGYVDPIYAAIGMASSSALVVANTLRLNTR